MKKKFSLNILIIFATASSFLFASDSQSEANASIGPDWKQELNETLPLLGHRNWILVVDKAFPLQNAKGVRTINTGEDLLGVLQYTLAQIDSSSHVKPIIYKDKELEFLNSELVPGVNKFKEDLSKCIGLSDVQVLLHDSVFEKIDEASELFTTLVLKTNGVIPYSSVFLQLDCKYWSSEKEQQLRKLMEVNSMQ